MLKKLLVTGLFIFIISTGFCQKDYFQQQADFKIDVTLNDNNQTLDGFETITYTNNSPDTLQYIWFHLWPNAFKNDRTAFSEQSLHLGRTDFYFSNEDQHGYINRLDFKVNGITAVWKDHPQFIDVIQLILPISLLPGKSITITTPFHEKIPYNFSRGGHKDHSYQITQWYPKPAVYDRTGWHEMPYLEQGEFYSEFGNYEVNITVPSTFVVAATGQLENKEELKWLLEKKDNKVAESKLPKTPLTKKDSKNSPVQTKYFSTKYPKKKLAVEENIPPVINKQTEKTKTLTYRQENVHDFAWFADRNFNVLHDTLKVSPEKVLDVFAFYKPASKVVWRNSIQTIKNTIISRSRWVGIYPYETVSVVEASMGLDGGMEYPGIASISPIDDEKTLTQVIEHEVGHNWFYGILASNERKFPWMDEGMNTFYDNRYDSSYHLENSESAKKNFFEKRIPENYEDLAYRTQITSKKDQPINTNSVDFSETNYGVIAYYKTALWMQQVEQYLGKETFDKCMQAYFEHWKFKHPSPEDFKRTIEIESGRNVDSLFQLLSANGNLHEPVKKSFKVESFFNFKNTDQYNYLFLSPAIGYNYYDKLMLGGLIHNYTLPEPTFHYFLAALYGTGSKKLNVIGRVGYNFMSYGLLRKTELSFSAEKFTMDKFTDSAGVGNYMGFTKIVPSIKITFRNKYANSNMNKWVQWKTYFITEEQLLFTRDTVQQQDVITYPKISRYLNQLTLAIENNRALYPYSAHIVGEQGEKFIRLGFTGNYYFNYPKGGGVVARLFAGKFIYLGDKTSFKQFETDRYHLNMTGPNGYEDYTYSNYFLGRNEFEKLPSHQIMIRDGGFKVRTDLLSSKIGKTDDWLTALNLTTTIPSKINPLKALPLKIELKAFLDIGTYADAWKNNAETGKFIYDAGLQLSLVKQIINIYVPVLYSKVYSNYYKQTIEKKKRFWNAISFSIDIQKFKLRDVLGLSGL
ncbi:MAG: M1 family metallopeptidase [Ginsengibacter sp.]